MNYEDIIEDRINRHGIRTFEELNVSRGWSIESDSEFFKRVKKPMALLNMDKNLLKFDFFYPNGRDTNDVKCKVDYNDNIIFDSSKYNNEKHEKIRHDEYVFNASDTYVRYKEFLEPAIKIMKEKNIPFGSVFEKDFNYKLFIDYIDFIKEHRSNFSFKPPLRDLLYTLFYNFPNKTASDLFTNDTDNKYNHKYTMIDNLYHIITSLNAIEDPSFDIHKKEMEDNGIKVLDYISDNNIYDSYIKAFQTISVKESIDFRNNKDFLIIRNLLDDLQNQTDFLENDNFDVNYKKVISLLKTHFPNFSNSLLRPRKSKSNITTKKQSSKKQ